MRCPNMMQPLPLWDGSSRLPRIEGREGAGTLVGSGAAHQRLNELQNSCSPKNERKKEEGFGRRW